MSISNGRCKKVTNKNHGTATAAVYPIIQPVNNEFNTKPNKQTSLADSHSVLYNRGQCVRAKSITEQTITGSVVELVNEVLPSKNSHLPPFEPIYWVKIQKYPSGLNWKTSTFIILIGLARGYQIWLVPSMKDGECEELVSERKGPLKIGHLLPLVTELDDGFRNLRPLFALVDGNPLGSESKYCTVSFLSLRIGKVVHSLSFEEPITEIDSSSKCVIIALTNSIIICDNGSLNEKCRLKVSPPPCGYTVPCFALSDSLLAFADTNAIKSAQSCGGEITHDEQSYGGQVINAAKTFTKTVSSFGESIVSFGASSQHNSKNSTKDSTNAQSGIVSVVNVNSLPPTNDNQFLHYVSHFATNDLIGHLAFGNGGRLLLTATHTSTFFNVFLIHPYPNSSKFGTVQHIYTLVRGNTAAKVIHSAFSPDNRWVAIATNHGTVHLFAMNPYGGQVSTRTHYGRLVNRESRFERSAGICSLEQPTSRTRHGSTHSSSQSATDLPLPFREHPATKSSTISRTVVNPRLTSYPPPISLVASALIKQRVLSAENFTAWASDNAPALITSAGKRNTSSINGVTFNGNWLADPVRRYALAFDTIIDSESKQNGKNKLCLLLMNTEGLLTEYHIEVRRSGSISTNSSTSSLSSANASFSEQCPLPTNEPGPNTNKTSLKTNISSFETPIATKIAPYRQWHLSRKRSASAVEVVDPPLAEKNPLNQLCARIQNKPKKDSPTKQAAWLQHVEVMTYIDPSRRLWMGPQFSFAVYASTGHTSAQLFNPNESNGCITTIQKCCPVLIEKTPSLGILNGVETSLDSTSRIICGSWSSEVDIRTVYTDGTYSLVKEKIEDAIRCDMGTVLEDEIVEKQRISLSNDDTLLDGNQNAKSVSSISSSLSKSISQSQEDLLNLSGIEL